MCKFNGNSAFITTEEVTSPEVASLRCDRK